jgi:hypothetical protein
VTNNNVLNVVIGGTTNGIVLNIDGVTGGINTLRTIVRSEAADAVTALNATTSLAAGAEYLVGAVGVFGTDAMRIYVNGGEEATSAPSYGSATWNDANDQSVADAIGSSTVTPPSATAAQFDGRISELAIWKEDIGSVGFVRLNRRLDARKVSPGSLVFYARMVENGGVYNIMSKTATTSCTTTGTVAIADHPRMLSLSGPPFMQATGAVAAATSVKGGGLLLGVGK